MSSRPWLCDWPFLYGRRMAVNALGFRASMIQFTVIVLWLLLSASHSVHSASAAPSPTDDYGSGDGNGTNVTQATGFTTSPDGTSSMTSASAATPLFPSTAIPPSPSSVIHSSPTSVIPSSPITAIPASPSSAIPSSSITTIPSSPSSAIPSSPSTATTTHSTTIDPIFSSTVAATSEIPPSSRATSPRTTVVVIIGTTEAGTFSRLNVGTLMAICVGCGLCFALSLLAVHILRKSRRHHESNADEAKRLRQARENSRQKSVRRQSEFDKVTDWAGSSLATSTLVFDDDYERGSSIEPASPTGSIPGSMPGSMPSSQRNSVSSESSAMSSSKLIKPDRDNKKSWTDEPDIEETNFSIGNEMDDDRGTVNRVKNFVVIDGGHDSHQRSGKHSKAKDRARQILAERRSTYTLQSQANEAAHNVIAEEQEQPQGDDLDGHVFVDANRAAVEV